MANSQLVSPFGRLSFPDFMKPRAYEEGAQEFFGAALLIPKQDRIGTNREFDGAPFSPYVALRGLEAAKGVHDLSELRKIVKELQAAKWGTKPPKLKSTFKDCDVVEPGEEGEETEGPAPEQIGHYLIRAKSKRRPLFWDAAKNEVTIDEVESMFYPGAWVRFVMGTYEYDGKANKGIGFGLRGVQFLRNDTPFAGRVNLDELSAIPEAEQAPQNEDLGDMA